MSATAFSNATEWDYWAEGWCNKCVRESACELIAEVLVDNTVPKQWSRGTDDLRDRYHCSEFKK